MAKLITKSSNHHHFWVEDRIVYETYTTIRGLRYNQLLELDFEYPDQEKLTDSMVQFLNNILQSKI